MTEHVFFDPDLEWLDHVQPVGLVIASNLIKELGLVPDRQTQADTAEVAKLIEADSTTSALADPWAFMSGILGWDARYVAGAPGGPAVPGDLSVHLPEHETTLSPAWAVQELSKVVAARGSPWQLLVGLEQGAFDLDDRGVLDGWEAAPQQRFERLLRETGVFAGVLISAKELRLVYAPRGETSGWLSFPLRDLASVSGRPMLAGLKRILGSYCLFNDADDRRLPALLKRSRDAQAAVSTKLAEQVLGALHELLRGMDRAETDLIRNLAGDRPGHLYEGLLAVLMRLVFILYAEDRDLIPSRTDAQARALYDENYSVRGLFAKLLEDAALNPDTMDERLGAWGRLIALFRLVHKGDAWGWIKGRGGKLFDPDAFPFLEGREKIDDAPRVVKVPDGFVLRILEGLMTIENKRGVGQGRRARERLSYRTLDVEQIGSVYETVMGFTVEAAPGAMLAIKAGKKNNVPVFVDLDALAAQNAGARLKRLKETTGRDKFGTRVEAEIKAARAASDLAAAFAAVVDNRGSPNEVPVAAGTPILQPTDERRRTGSHYTPRSLTEPIVRHALEPTFERLGPNARPEDILDIKVCDPAMGSGAFLVEACRALSIRLTQAWARWPETRPKIPADEDEELHARRLVAQRCLYGVDKNPMATDLARLSLWLATLARDHEFTFLDHALKTGDSLVGLNDKQFEAAHWDVTAPGLGMFKGLLRDRMKQSLKLRHEIRAAPDDEFRFVQEGRHDTLEKLLLEPRTIGDAIISAFFTEAKPKARETERARIESLITGETSAKSDKLREAAARLRQGDHPIQAFHWQLEFPEVFQRKNAGFDAIVGNPPFAGKNTVGAGNRAHYPVWLQALHEGAHGNADLVAHFFRRAFGLLRKDGVFGLIATNTIGQGDTRATGLTTILASGGAITHATRRLKWPGEAAVIVSVLHVSRGAAETPVLDGRSVRRISAYLVEGELDTDPAQLVENSKKGYEGCKIYGQGFLFDDQETESGNTSPLAQMTDLINSTPKNKDVLFPYLGGEEISTHPTQSHHRYVIDFNDRPLSRDGALKSWQLMSPRERSECITIGKVPGDYEGEVAEDWLELLTIVRAKVKPYRDVQKRVPLRERWWQFGERRPGLRHAIAGLKHVLVLTRISPHISFCFVPNKFIFQHMSQVFAYEESSFFSVLQSRIHEVWARFATATFEDRVNYSLTDCFRSFPFPEGLQTCTPLDAIGHAYHDHRAALMIERNEGLTKTYNRFHNRAETSADIFQLRELHANMDAVTLRAYGWNDLAEAANPEHLDNSNEDDHKYQGRYFWPSAFRDQVLARLLDLNAERAAAERRAGLLPVETDDEEGDDGEGTDE